MSISGVYILDLKGKSLISRSYRGDTETNIIDKFISLALESEEEGSGQPIVNHLKHTFAFIRYNNLYLVAVTRRNANVAIIFTFLHKLRECFVGKFWYILIKYIRRPLKRLAKWPLCACDRYTQVDYNVGSHLYRQVYCIYTPLNIGN